ncbi:PaaI family thioesterase [Marinobacter sp. X15-166B]|uniref:PaaI family thioesterase n=1 Tax=Marinobacter sp. X15-166B TaxID=1897620 RepID=UPI00085BF3CE|nr:PaaI family thioesterase [Marinobacter sp. X15-166B]OEY65139.1 phenylacetic acid degradation protein [Marinobacter sp. X15-166B]
MSQIQQRIEASFHAQSLMATLGARLISVLDGEVQIELPFSETLLQQQGYLHAGVITSIVDNACGYAALTKMPAGDEVVTAEFKTNFVRPALGERFVATGKVETAGRMLTVCRGEVVAFTGETSKVIALMQATMVNVKV